MKKLTLTVFLILSGCAKERTTQYFVTQGQLQLETPVTSVLTSDGSQTSQDRNPAEEDIEEQVFPVVSMDDTTDEKTLETLFNSFSGKESFLPKPDDVICEYIPQVRLQKTLGRLTCMKQTPQLNDPELISKLTSHHCSIDVSHTKVLIDSDRSLYEGLTLTEEESRGDQDSKTFVKKLGRFFCEKSINTKSGAVRYHCSMNLMHSGTFK